MIESDNMKRRTHASYQTSVLLRNILFVKRHMFVKINFESLSDMKAALCFERHIAAAKPSAHAEN